MASGKSIADNIVIVILSKILARAGSITMGIILVRLLSQADYGSYLQFNLLFLTITYLMIMSLPATIYYYLPRLQEEQAKGFILQTMLLLAVMAAFTCSGVYLLHERLFGSINNPGLARYLPHLLAVISLTMLLEVGEPLLITLRRPQLLAAISVCHGLANISLSLTVLLLGYGLWGILTVWASLLAGRLLFYLGYLTTLPGTFRDLFQTVRPREQLGYALPLGAGRMTGIVSGKVDKFVVSGFFSPAEYAIYGRGGLSLSVFSLFVQNVSTVILPRLVALVKENQIAECLRLWHSVIKRAALIIMPSFVFVYCFATHIFVLLFTERYLDSVPIFRLFVLTMPMQVAVYGILHQAFANTRIIFFNNAALLVTNVVLSIGLYHLMGFTGPALAAAINGYLFIFLNLAIVRGYFQVSWGRIFPWGHLLKVLVLSAALMAPVYPLVAWAGLGPALSLSLGGGLYGALYILSLLKLGLLSEQDRELILSWLKPAEIKRKFKLAVS